MLARIPTHARTFRFLAPFAAMLIIHRLLGLADNLLAAPEAGKPDGAIYNLVMVVVLWVGIAGYFVHTVRHAHENTAWVAAKLAVLTVIVGAMIWLSE